MTNKLSNRWLPLESNPEIMNRYIENLGINTDKFEFNDIYGLDEELLAMVAKPVIAVMLLFPITKEYKAFKEEQSAKIDAEGQTLSPNLYFTKQTIHNACGTVAIIHALANNKDSLQIDGEKPFGKFLTATANMTPLERAAYLMQDDQMMSAHFDVAQEGQTETPDIDAELDLHFIAFIEKDGHLYEMDGGSGKDYPINHGPVTPALLLEESSKVVKKFMAINPNENRYTLIALSAKNQ